MEGTAVGGAREELVFDAQGKRSYHSIFLQITHHSTETPFNEKSRNRDPSRGTRSPCTKRAREMEGVLLRHPDAFQSLLANEGDKERV